MHFDLKAFLEDQVGWEEPVHRRRHFFNKLRRLYDQHGLKVLRIIAEVWAEAGERAARDKVKHYFCRVVKLRLIEAKFWEEERRYSEATLEDIIASGVFKSKEPLPLVERELISTPWSKTRQEAEGALDALRSRLSRVGREDG